MEKYVFKVETKHVEKSKQHPKGLNDVFTYSNSPVSHLFYFCVDFLLIFHDFSSNHN
jgi:hypothetical protein